MSSVLALSRFLCCRNSTSRPLIAACSSSSTLKRSDSTSLNLVERRRNFLKAKISAKVPVDYFRLNKGWVVLSPNSASKAPFTTRAMAQSAGTDIPLIVVYITVPNKETATKLSLSLVTNKLAACVNQVPGVVTTYMWEGKLETDDEILLIVKTRQSLLDALTVHVQSNHPFTVPEVIALPILGGSQSYIKWVAENTLEQQNS